MRIRGTDKVCRDGNNTMNEEAAELRRKIDEGKLDRVMRTQGCGGELQLNTIECQLL